MALKTSYLAQVIKLVKDAQDAKSKTQLLADQAAKWLTIIALVAGVATFATWLAIGKDLAFAMERMVTVIVICCPSCFRSGRAARCCQINSDLCPKWTFN
jgi:Cu2+-exporting ATPase